MKTASFILLLSLLCFACTQRTPLQSLIHDADVVKVFVYSGNGLVMHYESNDVPTIQYWKNFIADDSAKTSTGCIREGKIIFKTSEDSTIMEFSLKEGCRYVTYQLNGMNYNKSLTEAGRMFIDSLMRAQ